MLGSLQFCDEIKNLNLVSEVGCFFSSEGSHLLAEKLGAQTRNRWDYV